MKHKHLIKYDCNEKSNEIIIDKKHSEWEAIDYFIKSNIDDITSTDPSLEGHFLLVKNNQGKFTQINMTKDKIILNPKPHKMFEMCVKMGSVKKVE